MIFITEIFRPQLLSSHATCLHTRLTEYFLHPAAYPVLSLISQLSSLMNAFEAECLCLHEISVNVNKLFTLLLFRCFLHVIRAVKLLPVYLIMCFFYTALCCCLFTSFSPFLYWWCYYTFVYSLIMQTSPLFLFLVLLFIILITPFPFL